jgi:porin
MPAGGKELDADAVALSKIPADSLIQADPLSSILHPIDKVVRSAAKTLRLKAAGATYTS